MDKFRADFRALDQLNIAALGKRIVARPKQTTFGDTEKSVFKSAVAFAKFVKPHPTLDLLGELIRVSDVKPAITLLAPLKIPIGFTSASSKFLTLALGGNFEGFFVGGVIVQGGFYGSTTPEVGAFISGGGGIFLGAGATAGMVLTVIFGPPSDFSGIALGVAVDVALGAGFGVGPGGTLLFSLGPPSIRFLGFSVGISAGVASCPVTVSLQVTRTVLRPLLTP